MLFANAAPPSLRLRHSVQRDLNVYALAAGAAGVGLLALTQSAKAEIVYTPAHIKFRTSASRWIDLDHDGVNDFRIEDAADLGLGATSFVIAFGLHPGDAVRVRQPGSDAQPLPAGTMIGPANIFSPSATMAIAYRGSGGGTWGENHYLDLQFELGGQKHYGWAKFSVALNQQGTVTAEIKGYAYETTANKPIRAGETKEPNTAVKQNPEFTRPQAPTAATLGVLALGSPGLSHLAPQRVAAAPMTCSMSGQRRQT
ncbi:MAG: hypothetical protein WB562_10460 [Candidatus Sulfotelmatobacter sp.]